MLLFEVSCRVLSLSLLSLSRGDTSSPHHTPTSTQVDSPVSYIALVIARVSCVVWCVVYRVSCIVFRRQLYAMVSETLRYKPLLDRLVVKADPK